MIIASPLDNYLMIADVNYTLGFGLQYYPSPIKLNTSMLFISIYISSISIKISGLFWGFYSWAAQNSTNFRLNMGSK
jgi:hypothetical protein